MLLLTLRGVLGPSESPSSSDVAFGSVMRTFPPEATDPSPDTRCTTIAMSAALTPADGCSGPAGTSRAAAAASSCGASWSEASRATEGPARLIWTDVAQARA